MRRVSSALLCMMRGAAGPAVGDPAPTTAVSPVRLGNSQGRKGPGIRLPGPLKWETRLGRRCPTEPLREPQEWPFTDSGNDLDSGSELRAPVMQTRVSSASTKPAPIFSLKVRCKRRPCLRLANISAADRRHPSHRTSSGKMTAAPRGHPVSRLMSRTNPV